MFNLQFIKKLPDNPNNHTIYDFKKKCYDESLEKLNNETKITFYALQNLGVCEKNALMALDEFFETISKLENLPSLNSVNVNGVYFPEYGIENLKFIAKSVALISDSIYGVPFNPSSLFEAMNKKRITSHRTALETIINPQASRTSELTVFNTSGLLSALPLCSAVEAALQIADNAKYAMDEVKTAAMIFKTLLNVMGEDVKTNDYVELKKSLLEKLSSSETLIGKSLFNTYTENSEDSVTEDLSGMEAAGPEITEACNYLNRLRQIAEFYQSLLENAIKKYKTAKEKCDHLIRNLGKTDWENDYSKNEMILMQNMIGLAGLIYKMCSVKLIKESQEDGSRQINTSEIENIVSDYMQIMR